MNASFDGRPARFVLQSDRLVLIDPLALDGLASDLAAVAAASDDQQEHMLRTLGERGLHIGLHPIQEFRPGWYQADLSSFAPAEDSTDAGVFDVDSGTVVLIDLTLLEAVTKSLTWDRYDKLLQSPLEDESLLDAINAEVGRPGFAIISADADSPFSGDGAFHLLPDQPRRG